MYIVAGALVVRTEIEEIAEIGSERCRNDHLRDSEIHKVDYEHRDGCESWNEDLVPPADVEEVVAYTEQRYRLERQDCGQIRRELRDLRISVVHHEVLRIVLTLPCGNLCKKRPVSTCRTSTTKSRLPPPEVAATMSL